MGIMGNAYYQQIALHGKIDPQPQLRTLTYAEFNEGYDRIAPNETVTHHEFELWEDHGDGTCDVIDPMEQPAHA